VEFEDGSAFYGVSLWDRCIALNSSNCRVLLFQWITTVRNRAMIKSKELRELNVPLDSGY
jgi:hypothetical protein